jgi:hypothetical protein
LAVLAIRLGFDGVQTHLVGIMLIWSRFSVLVSRPATTTAAIPLVTLFARAWPLGDAASTKGKEAPAEEEEKPRSEGQPNRITNGGRANGTDSCFCDKEEDEIEDEC